jgi:ribosomal-protein-serine acetyltransferase
MTKDIDPILIDVPMPITTQRLILRPPQAGDGQALYDAKQDSLKELLEWMVWAKDDPTVQDNEVLARKNHIKFLAREDMLLLAFDRTNPDRMVAGTGLHRFDWKTRIFEIGYWVRTPETGKGYAQEITNALVRYAFNALSANKVTIRHAEGNTRSQRVIKKLEFEKEGILQKNELLPDRRLVDTHTYARFNDKGLPNLTVKWGIEP